MDNGNSLLDVIDDPSDFFGSQNDSSGMFNWADEFLGDNEMESSGRVTKELGNLATNTPSNILLTSSHYAATSSMPAQSVSIATPFLQQNTSVHVPEQQTTVMPAVIGQSIVNPLQSVAGQSGLSASVVQQGGQQQYILKTASGNQIQLTQSQLQQHLLQQQQQNSAQPSSAPSSMMNRSVTPNSGGLSTVSFGLNSSQFKSASPGPNVNIVHLPGNIQAQTQQQQQQSQLQPTQQFQIAPGTFLQIPGGTQNLGNTSVVQGQQILAGQQGSLMNSQNTVIQNPNVVNVNVATHQAVLCNSPAQQPQQQQQQRLNTQNPFNIQGTLIQTAEGKSILIPSQNFAQPINIQQLSMAQPVGQSQTQNPVSNMIQLGQQQTNTGSDSSQSQGLQQIVLNNQGQQILVQRAPTPSGQSQNIIVRTTSGQQGLVQIQQRGGQLQTAGQTLQALTSSGASPQLKIIQQTGQNQTGIPMINIGGQNISLQQLGNIQGLQVIQQQQNQQQSTPQGQGQMLQQGQITIQQQGASNQGQLNAQAQIALNTSSQFGSQQGRSTTPGHSSQGQGQVTYQQGQRVTVQQNNTVGLPMQQFGRASVQQQNVQMSNPPNRVAPVNVQTSQASTENARNTQAQILLQQIQRSLKATRPSNELTSNVTTTQSAPNVNLMLVKKEIKQENAGNTQFQACSTSSSNQNQLMYQTCNLKKEPDLIESLVKQEVASSVVTGAECSQVTSTMSQSTPMSLYMLSNSGSTSTSGLKVSSSSFVSANNMGSDIRSSAGGVGSVSSSNMNSTVGQVKSGATVQTIQLPPELQHQFHRVNQEIKKVQTATNITLEQKQMKLAQLQVFQKKILLKGRVLATTRAEPHHIKQGIAALSQSGLNSTVSGLSQSSSTVLNSSTPVQQTHAMSVVSSSQIPSNTTVKDLLKSMSASQDAVITNTTDLMKSAPQSSNQSMTSSHQLLPSNSHNMGPGGLSFMNSSTPSTQALSVLLSTTSIPSLATPTVTSTNQLSDTSISSSANQIEQTPPQASRTEPPRSQDNLVSNSVSSTSTPDIAVPTQIKIANKVLTLSLTQAQRDKVQSYLDKMTPEQQQQYLQTQQGVLQRIQKQQELNAQVKAQMLAQKKQQAMQSNQSAMGAVTSSSPTKATEAQIIKTEVKSIPVPTSTVQVNKPSSDGIMGRNLLRGQKRNYMDIPKGTLINQQIKQDQNHASNPDTRRPFKSRGDACRRLLRYHVFQSYGPSSEEFGKFDNVMSDIATDLLQKKDSMLDRFRVLLLQETMRCEPSSELVMLQRMQNQDLRKIIEEEKEQVKNDPDLFVPMPAKFLKKDDKVFGLSSEKIVIEDDSSGTEDLDSTLVKSDTASSDLDDTKKVKKLIIKTDGDHYRSTFKRLDSSMSFVDETETANASCDNLSIGQSAQPNLYESEDTSDLDMKQFSSMHDEAEQAALLISSAEESQDSQCEDDSLYRRLNSNGVDKSSSLQNDGSCELTSESMYYDESPSVTLNSSRPSVSSYNSLSRLSSVDESRKYIPSHSPVSNASSDNDVIIEESRDSLKLGNIGKFDMYQPITESLTDSEENSHYSADNSAEQNSIIVDDDDGHIARTNWKSASGSKTVEEDISDQESDQEVKAQMESAINSILSLGQGDFNQSTDVFSHTNPQTFNYNSASNYPLSGANMAQTNSVQGMSEMNPFVIEGDENSDLDMAVNSILM